MSKFELSKKLLAVFLIAVMGSAVLLFGFGYYVGYRVGYEEAFGLTPVRIGYLVADIHQVAFFVAYFEKFFEAEGLRPTKLEYVNGPSEMLAFAAGDLDAGYVGAVPALISKSQAVDFVIMASANLEGSAIVAKPEIQTVQDLDGKTVGTPGIGTIQASLLYMVEKKFNITMNVKHYSGPTTLPLDFEKGSLDAYVAWEPFVAEVVVNDLGHVVYTSHDIVPDHQCCVFYVSGKVFRETPDLAKKLVRIHLRAMNYVKERPSDAMKIFADRTGKTSEVVQESWKRMIWNYHLNTTSMKTFVDYLTEQDKIQSADVLNTDDFINSAVDIQMLTEVEANAP